MRDLSERPFRLHFGYVLEVLAVTVLPVFIIMGWVTPRRYVIRTLVIWAVAAAAVLLWALVKQLRDEAELERQVGSRRP